MINSIINMHHSLSCQMTLDINKVVMKILNCAINIFENVFYSSFSWIK